MTRISATSIESQLQKLLPKVPTKDLKEFISITNYTSYEDKDIIIPEGDKSKHAFFVLEGIVRGYLYKNNSEEKTILLRGSGIFIASPEEIFNNQSSRLEYVSIGETSVLNFNYDTFEQLALQNKAILNLYLAILKEAIIIYSYRIETMITMSNEERYKDLIKRNPLFLQNTCKKHIASYLGITPVSLSRITKRINKC